MWTRSLIKEKAREVLKFNYWKAFVVSLVILIAEGENNGSRISSNSNVNKEYINFNGIIPHYVLSILGQISLFIASIAIIILIFRIFLGYLLEVGGRKFFIKAAGGESNLGYLGYCFNKGRYLNVLMTMLIRDIYTFLWTLLFIIPGIVKSYSYRMVPYILADNPSMDYKRAIELSIEMTDGEKWNIFVLDLSFLGWYILGILALVIGTLFVKPYVNATEAELYLVLRQSVLDSGITSNEELNIGSNNFN